MGVDLAIQFRVTEIYTRVSIPTRHKENFLYQIIAFGMGIDFRHVLPMSISPQEGLFT